jgi:glycosyltransferase involved in cell wall biosynthesis
VRVSIVTAVHNGAREIAATLQSVSSQTHTPIEHIIIDGASTDDTVATVRRLGKHVSVLVSERDSGVYDAFNKGLARCTGDLIGFLNAGDRYADEHSVAKLVAELEVRRVGAVFADLALVDAGSGRIVRSYRSSSFAVSRIGSGYMPAHPTLFIRREIYQRFGGYDSSYRIAGDFELVARIFGRAHIPYAYVQEVLVHMQQGGISNRGWRSKWIITREMHRACVANAIRTGWARLLLRLPVKYVVQVLQADSWRQKEAE